MKKIALLTNMLAPYRVPLFRAINENPEIELFVFLETIREVNRHWNIELQNLGFGRRLRGLSIPLGESELHINPDIILALSKLNPDALIIGGYSSLTAWMAMLWAKSRRIPTVLWSGSTLLSSRYLNGPIYSLRKVFVSLADAYITYGFKASEFLEYHGACKDKIVTGFNVGDVHFYREAVEQWRQNNSELYDESKVHLLFVGQLIPRKGIREMLKALSMLKEHSWELVIVGSGPLQEELEEFVKATLPSRVQCVGFHQPKALIPYFGVSDVLLIPSLIEVGSIVMSEGLAAGLYICASKYDGSTYNLIREPENGVIVDPKNQNDMVTKLRWLLTQQPWRGQRKKIVQSIAPFTPERYASSFIQAVSLVTD